MGIESVNLHIGREQHVDQRLFTGLDLIPHQYVGLGWRVLDFSARSGRQHVAHIADVGILAVRSIQAREAGDRASIRKVCRPLHGLEEFYVCPPRVPLRSTLGYMLPPVSRA
jgi:hypothetical protein